MGVQMSYFTGCIYISNTSKTLSTFCVEGTGDSKSKTEPLLSQAYSSVGGSWRWLGMVHVGSLEPIVCLSSGMMNDITLVA